MNRQEKFALLIGLANLAVVLLFPPFDAFSLIESKALFFAGFQFVLSRGNNETINSDVLFLEMVVLLVNIGVAWLVSRHARHTFGTQRHSVYQSAIQRGVATNLTVILLFPPFEYLNAIGSPWLPTFQGFYFIFSADPMLTIVTPILYLEVILVLLNGAALWLLFRKDRMPGLPPQGTMQLMRKLKSNTARLQAEER